MEEGGSQFGQIIQKGLIILDALNYFSMKY